MAAEFANVEPVEAVQQCEDRDKIYKVCRDQKGIYNSKKEEATKASKPMLLIFGADWCPRCKALHNGLALVNNKPILAEIALLDGFKKVSSGQDLLSTVLNKSDAPAKFRIGSGSLPMPMIS